MMMSSFSLSTKNNNHKKNNYGSTDDHKNKNTATTTNNNNSLNQSSFQEKNNEESSSSSSLMMMMILVAIVVLFAGISNYYPNHPYNDNDNNNKAIDEKVITTVRGSIKQQKRQQQQQQQQQHEPDAWMKKSLVLPSLPSSSSSSTSSSLLNNVSSSFCNSHFTKTTTNQQQKAAVATFPMVHRSDYGTPAQVTVNPNLFHPNLRSCNHNREHHQHDNHHHGDEANDDDDSTHQEQPYHSSSFLKVPFPTGAFWTNLVVKPTADRGFSFPIMAYPYMYKWFPIGLLQVSYPGMHRLSDNISIRDIFYPDLTFSATTSPISTTTSQEQQQQQQQSQRYIMDFDSLSVTLRYQFSLGSSDSDGVNHKYNNNYDKSSNKHNGGDDNNDDDDDVSLSSLSSYWETYVVQGSPYVTLKYARASPILTALSIFESFACPPTSQSHNNDDDDNNNNNNANDEVVVCQSLTQPQPQQQQENVILHGTRFIITTREKKTWWLFASTPITLQWDCISKRTITTTTTATTATTNNNNEEEASFSGILRLALVPPTTTTSTAATATTTTTVGGEQALMNGGDDENENENGFVEWLVNYSNVYPVRGGVSWSFQLANNNDENENEHENENSEENFGLLPLEKVATVQFRFGTQQMSNYYDDSNDKLFILALPHHIQVLQQQKQQPSDNDDDDDDNDSKISFLLQNNKKNNFAYRCIKGPMTPILLHGGNNDDDDSTSSSSLFVWKYDEPLPSIGFESASSLKKAQHLHKSTVRTILQQVEQDMTRVLPTLTENVYGFGKQVARLAQLTHIASVLTTQTPNRQTNHHQQQQQQSSLHDNANNDESNNNDDDRDGVSLVQRTSQLLHDFLRDFLHDKSRDRLLYDMNFGGIVTSDGLKNSEGDFGNGWYNDHLFHYGYILYACAIMGRLNSTFVSEFSPAVDGLLHDVAGTGTGTGTSLDDQDMFPLARHKLWYDGHSYASGLFPFADGKSQESSSEAVNCYYGAYLWASVRQDIQQQQQQQKQQQFNHVSDFTDDNDSGYSSGTSSIDWNHQADFARLLLATEIRGAKTYWHMEPPSSDDAAAAAKTDNQDDADPSLIEHAIYEPDFAKNFMVGNLGMTDVSVATWFGTEKLYVHMINFLPITAITRVLFDHSYIEKEFTNVIEPIYSSVEMAWRGYTICDYAMLNPMGAWQDALELRSYELDQAISQSQVLYFISTMDHFAMDDADASNDNNVEPENPHDGKPDQSNTTPEKSLPECSDNTACASLGLSSGLCCPTSDGLFLACCESLDAPKQPESKDEDDERKSGISTSALCSENESCAALGLSGKCCPTSSGTYLGCCGTA